MRRVLVTGAGGFIGHHMVRRLKTEGCWVRGVDRFAGEYAGWNGGDEFMKADLRDEGVALEACKNVEDVYHFAADMGGMGFISRRHASTFRNNMTVDMNMIEAARVRDVERFLYASSACVYPDSLQKVATTAAQLQEADAWPADPQGAYGLEKLTAERLVLWYAETFGTRVRIARFHNIYGSEEAWRGGREKAPAAICRKVAAALMLDRCAAPLALERRRDLPIDIWGDGTACRSFCFIDDAIEGVRRLMESTHGLPLNIGSEEGVSINDLVQLVVDVANDVECEGFRAPPDGQSDPKRVTFKIGHIEGPVGVQGRNSDNKLCRAVLGGWSPQTPLRTGLRVLYTWVAEQMRLGLVAVPPDNRPALLQALRTS